MSSPPSIPSATFKIGNSVSGVSSCGDPFGGVVYAVDDALGLAVLRAPGDIQNSHHVQIINCDATKTDVKVLNSVSPPPNSRREEEERAALPVIDKGRQERRFETAVKAAQFVAGTNAIRSSLDSMSFDRRRLAFCAFLLARSWTSAHPVPSQNGMCCLIVLFLCLFGTSSLSVMYHSRERVFLYPLTPLSLSLSLSLSLMMTNDDDANR